MKDDFHLFSNYFMSPFTIWQTFYYFITFLNVDLTIVTVIFPSQMFLSLMSLWFPLNERNPLIMTYINTMFQGVNAWNKGKCVDVRKSPKLLQTCSSTLKYGYLKAVEWTVVLPWPLKECTFLKPNLAPGFNQDIVWCVNHKINAYWVILFTFK